MATEAVIIPVKTEGADKAVKDLEKVTKATEDSTKATDEQGETLVDVAKDYEVFGVSINSVTQGFKNSIGVIRNTVTGLKALRVALAATGIGLVVIALTSLVAFFTKSQEGSDTLTKALNRLKFAFTAVIDQAKEFGKGLVQIFTGDFVGGWNTLRDAVTEVGDAIERNIQLADEYTTLTFQLATANNNLIVQTAALNEKIATSREILGDETAALNDRIRAGEQAIENARLLADITEFNTRKRLAQIDAEIAAGETLRDDPILTERARLEAQLLDLEAQRARTTLRIQRELETVRKKAIEEEGKRQVELAEVVISLERRKANVAIEGSRAKSEADSEANTEIAKNTAKQTEFGIQAALADIRASLAQALAKAFGQTGIGGFLAGTVILGAFDAIIGRLTALVPPSIPVFAKGGFIGGRLHSQGGTIIEAERGEYIINRKSMSDPQIASIAQALNNFGQSKGFRFQDGGFIPQAQPSFQDIDNLIQRLPRAVLVTEDLNRVQQRVSVTENRATL